MCDAKGLDTDAILEEIDAELSSDDSDVGRRDEADLGALIGNVLLSTAFQWFTADSPAEAA